MAPLNSVTRCDRYLYSYLSGDPIVVSLAWLTWFTCVQSKHGGLTVGSLSVLEVEDCELCYCDLPDCEYLPVGLPDKDVSAHYTNHAAFI